MIRRKFLSKSYFLKSISSRIATTRTASSCIRASLKRRNASNRYYPMTRPLINIVIPVYNEEHILEASIGKIASFLAEHNQYEYEVIIANNASTDGTLGVALRLQDLHREVKVLHLEEKGRGR